MTRFAQRLRNHLGAGVRLAVAAAAIGAAASSAAQLISDVPMAVKNNVPPNFMFMIDSSGSMRHIVPSAPYDPAVNYTPAGCAGANVLGTGSEINLRVLASGVPRIAVGGQEYRHWSLAPSGTDRRCFNRVLAYSARLSVTTGGFPRNVTGSSFSRYDGNYLNWYFGNADGHPASGWDDRKLLSAAAQAAGQTVQKRVEVAKEVTKSLIDSLPTAVAGTAQPAMRIGLSTYSASSDGGKLLSAMKDLAAPPSTNTATSIGSQSFNAVVDTLVEGGDTPLASTLADIGRYLASGYSGDITAHPQSNPTKVNIDTFFRLDGTDQSAARNACLLSGGNRSSCANANAARPIQQWCQRSYVYLLTDGIPNGDRVFNNNPWLRDYDGDCQGALKSNCVSNGATGAWDKKNDRLYDTKGSDYLDDVAKALSEIDLRPDLAAPAGRTKQSNVRTYVIGFADEQVKDSALLASTAENGGGLFLTADDGNALSAAFRKVLADSLAKDAAASAVAVANAQITLNNVGYASSYNSGYWYGDLVAYSLDTTSALQTGADLWSLRVNLDAQASASRKIVTYNGSSGVAFDTGLSYAGKPATLTGAVIAYLRGDRSGEGSTYRKRHSVLGDIVNAEPVVVNYPGNVPIVFQGANDGMLHVVDGRTDASIGTRGQELWAYVPQLLHGSLADLASPSYSHRYYIDGTPVTAEVSGVGSTSRMLVGSLGKGGRGYYALDISSYAAATQGAAASKVMWEFTDKDMGYSFGSPLIVRTAAGWRVLVTSGYDDGTLNTDGKGRLWVLDPANGSVVATLATGVGSTSNPAGLAHASRLANTPAGAIVRYVWGGDLLGNVWRFDLDTNQVVRIAALTDAIGAAQPVTSPPEVGLVSGSTSKFVVMLGTGRYLSDADVPGAGANAWATQRQTLYGLFDNTTDANPTLPDLRGANGTLCPVGGGNGDLVCQSLTLTTNTYNGTPTYAATTHAVNPASRRGWYIDLPADANLSSGRIVSKPSLTPGGTLALTVNIPTNVQCDPGGRSWYLAIDFASGGAVVRNVGGNTYYDAGYFLGYALASRTVIVTTAKGKRALIRMSDKTVQAPDVPEPVAAGAQWRRVYWRPVKN